MGPYRTENDHIKPHRRANLDYRFKYSWNIFSHNYVSHIFLITLSLNIQPIDSNSFYPGQSLSFSIHIQNQVVYGNWGSGILWLVDLQYIM